VAVVISAVATFVATDPSFASGTADSAATIAISSRALTATDAASASSAATDQTPVSIVHNADGTVTVTPRTPSTSASLDELVQAQVVPAELDPELKCLAGAVYFESKGETLAGQLAVARVVINRSQSGDFPDSICGVVYQPSQFSFIRDGRMPSIKTGSRAWPRAIAIAQIALNDSWDSSAEGALYFHARRVSPGWKHTKLASIDNHIFYR
jgi:spore germination cell wall hydrolase CwlJ-like protein